MGLLSIRNVFSYDWGLNWRCNFALWLWQNILLFSSVLWMLHHLVPEGHLPLEILSSRLPESYFFHLGIWKNGRVPQKLTTNKDQDSAHHWSVPRSFLCCWWTQLDDLFNQACYNRRLLSLREMEYPDRGFFKPISWDLQIIPYSVSPIDVAIHKTSHFSLSSALRSN